MRNKNFRSLSMIFGLCVSFLFLVNADVQANSLPQCVHVIGDSHSLAFSGMPSCKVHWIGPVTMHRVGRDGLNAINLATMGVQEGDAVVFCFGEIDVRCHVGKQRDVNNRTLDEILDTLVYHYFYTIILNRMLYKEITCIVYAVVPPTDMAYNPAFPSYGSLEDRILISKLLNTKLAMACSLAGIKFLDVYDDYANADGSLNPTYSDGGWHVHPAYNQIIYQKLCQLLT